MPIDIPTLDQLRAVAARCGLTFSEADLASYREQMAGALAAYNMVDEMSDEIPAPTWPRPSGNAPAAAENPHNAWYWRTRIKGASTGKLAGKRIALKDNIYLAGTPMMNGAATLEGYVPDFDATVVQRVLDAGGEIVGKAHCEYFCLSGGSHTNAKGPVHNPHRRGHSAGGSSSGCAVVVATGEVDMAIGGDQGGSIRMPAALCGVYGMKPTWGLVPYTGIMPIEIFVDHVGPITADVRDNALLLEVIAGDDGYDPRIKAPTVQPYASMLDGGVGNMRIGVLREGFMQPGAEEAVNACVRRAAQHLAKLGAAVEDISIPSHMSGAAVWTPIGVEGLTQTMMWGDGYGLSRNDLYSLSLMKAHRGWRSRADQLSESAKLLLMLGTHINDRFGPHYYGKAINISRRLRRDYDDALKRFDLLLMPTTPMTAPPIPGPSATRAERIDRTIDTLPNTAPFDITHHPAMSIPCGMADGLPVGMMLVGRHFDEPTIYRAAYAFEQSGDWKSWGA